MDVYFIDIASAIRLLYGFLRNRTPARGLDSILQV